MKALVVHNYYRSAAPSGEDYVFENEVALLKNNGIDVVTYERYNDEALHVNKVTLAHSTTWSKKTVVDLESLIDREKPDIAHFHNTWYLISPSAYYACRSRGVPIVQTLHNYRMFCVNGLLLKSDHVCEDCLEGHASRSIIYGCYRDSRLSTIPVYIAQRYHRMRGTWHNTIDAYITLTEFAREKVSHYGISAPKIFVKPNFTYDCGGSNKGGTNSALYVGRFSQEKGIHLLLEAHNQLQNASVSVKLRLVGGGDLTDRIEQFSGDSLEIVGRRPHSEIVRLIGESNFTIVPSLWYEMFPLVVIESFACGKPVIASRIGALPGILQDGRTGLLFEPGNSQDLASKMKWMIENKDACIEMGENARKVFEEKYTAERNFEILMDIYNTVLSRKRQALDTKATSIVVAKYDSARNIINDDGTYDGHVLLQGVSFLPADINTGLHHVTRHISRKDGGFYCFANIHVVMESHRDPELKRALNNAAGVFADGMGTAGALKYLSYMFKGRVRGADLMLMLCEYAANNNLRIFFYGNTDKTLAKLSNVLHSKYPGLNIAGKYSPPFRDLNREEDEEIVEMINKVDPDILFVSLGAPKQEKWMAAHKDRIRVVQLGVGAAFDYIAGNLKESPDWMQRHYLEWLYRLPQQPKKTIGRMLLLPEFLIRLFIQRFWK